MTDKPNTKTTKTDPAVDAELNAALGEAEADRPKTLVERIVDYVRTYVTMGEDEVYTLALWVLHTWTFSTNYRIPPTTPYLYIYSAERRSGKTRTLEVLEPIVYEPTVAASASAAAMYRAIEAAKTTLMLDEVDTIWSGAKNEDMRGVLNSGYKRNGTSLRTVGREAVRFSTFTPKVLAGIDNAMLPDTVRDRTIPIHMHRQPEGESAPFYAWLVEDMTADLMSDIQDWVAEYYPRVMEAVPPAAIPGIGDRGWEIAMPLVMLAECFGAEFAAEARERIARLLTPDEAKLSPGEQMLSDIRDAFDEDGQTGPKAALTTAKILAKLGDGWSGKLLANRLRVYGIRPGTGNTGDTGSIRYNGRNERGYYRRSFEEAWETYLNS